MKNIENNGVTWEEALLLMTDKQEWRSWIAQCAIDTGRTIGLRSKVRSYMRTRSAILRPARATTLKLISRKILGPIRSIPTC